MAVASPLEVAALIGEEPDSAAENYGLPTLVLGSGITRTETQRCLGLRAAPLIG
jgi:hypothetical protein